MHTNSRECTVAAACDRRYKVDRVTRVFFVALVRNTLRGNEIN